MSHACTHTFILFAALATSLLTACGDGDDTTPPQTSNQITFNSSVVSMLSRGTPITPDDQTALKTAGVYAYYTGTDNFDPVTSLPNYMDNQLLTRSTNTAWTYSPGKYWPDAANKLTFLAYAPHNTTCSGITLAQETGSAFPKMSFAVPSDAKNQVDLLISEPAKDVTRAIETVPLNMKHALTMISFSAAVTDAKTEGIVRVNKISIANVTSSGSTLLNTPVVWDNLNNTTTYTLSVDDGTLVNKLLTTTLTMITATNSYLLLMPQLFTDEQAKIRVEYSNADGQDIIYEESFSMLYTEETWTPGKAINYQIRLNAKKVEITASIVPWVKAKEFYGSDDEDGYLTWE